jgi:hypothetical protein
MLYACVVGPVYIVLVRYRRKNRTAEGGIFYPVRTEAISRVEAGSNTSKPSAWGL